MPFIEAPTTFYMGRRYNPETRRLDDEVVYYDSRDLTTHMVVVGMTGSGKTGMCISLLEEAVLDNIPAICIDPKGDITNLLLTFPNLRPEDFAPWVNVEDARRAGLSVEEYTSDIAQQWRDGLASWSIVPPRIAAMKNAAQFNIYTPGSDAGLPVSILHSLAAPREGWVGYEEAHRERISGIVTALMALIGKQVEPVKDREHVLVSNIFENAWKNGHDLTLEDIIIQVQKPPFAKLGVFDVNTFFPEKDRFKLAMELNNIIASPSFQSWINGEPLDIPRLLYTAEGRPKVSIFYMAHLTEAERSFIITLLLENMLAWMRSLSGTTSLRSLLYFDEVFGHFPPAPYNPPTKEPLLRLLKQARAFGIGIVLATQNPGDLDYKGLSNAGTWIIGKLQTDNDKRRVLGGLQAAATADSNMDVASIDTLLSNLAPRVFLMNNVHDGSGPYLFHTRWTMSYLRGPLTRQQIRTLMEPRLKAMQGLYVEPMPAAVSSVPYGATLYPTTPPPAQVAAQGTVTATPPPSTLPGTPATPASSPEQTGLNPSLFRPLTQRSATPPPSSLPGSSTPPPPLPEFPHQTGNSVPLPPDVADEASTSPALESLYQTPITAPFSQGINPPTPERTVSLTQKGPDLPDGYSEKPPVLSASRAQFYLPISFTVQQAMRQWEQRMGYEATKFGGSQLLYRPVLLAQAVVRYLDRKTGVETDQRWAFHVPNVEGAGFIRWSDYQATPIDPAQISQEPFGMAYYGTPSAGLTDSKRMTALKTELVDYVYRSAAVTVFYNSTLDVYGMANESRRDYLIRVSQLAREKRDQEIDATTKKFDAAIVKLEDRLRKEQRELDGSKQVLDELKREDLYTTGEAVMGLLKGHTAYTLSRMSRARRYKKQAAERTSVTEQNVYDLEDQIERAQEQLADALREVNDKWAKVASTVEEVKISPLKKDIALEVFGIGWVPAWYVTINNQQVILPAYPAKQTT
ncbi:MAG: DUF87 domain-containing protein [Anaerolineae bacterium]|nr:DUF87 domain-containing protein [Anaerolineae bacterium]